MDQKSLDNRKKMPGVAELVDAHIEAFGTDFVVMRCIDYSTHQRSTKKGQVPYEFPEDDEIPNQLFRQAALPAEDV